MTTRSLTDLKKRLLLAAAAVLTALFVTAFLAPAFDSSAAGAGLGLEDGVYTVDVVLEGGSGRAEVTSPAQMTVNGGEAFAVIEWSSANYDYMVVGQVTYYPLNTEGNSVFEIPVQVLDEPIDVTADTTAMSTPHEIEYTLTFSLAADSGFNFVPVIVIVIAAAAAALVVAVVLKKRRRKDLA